MRIGPDAPLRPGRFLVAIALSLAACAGEPDPPGAVRAEEDRQLNDAAASLDANAAGSAPDGTGNTSR